MPDILLAIIMGFVEGMTEFLPVSSTGHLILASNLLDFSEASGENFEIIIQIGAIFAVVLLYFQRFWGLLFPRKDKETGKAPKFSGVYGLFLLFLTCLPASLLGLIFHNQIKALFSVPVVLFSLVFGAICMLITERIQEKKFKIALESPLEDGIIDSVDKLTPMKALGIGLFQILALLPGFSRSGSTIMGGMLLGVTRKTSAEYSFLVAVPIIVAAAGYDFISSYDTLNIDDISFFLVAIVSSFIFAIIAVKGFIASLSKLTLRPFAYYRIILAVALYFYFYM